MSPSDPSSGSDTSPSSKNVFKARVHVFPRPQILDPQGKAIGEALTRVGFDEVRGVRAGKTFDIEIEAVDQPTAEARLTEICEKLLANTIVEDFSFEVEAES